MDMNKLLANKTVKNLIGIGKSEGKPAAKNPHKGIWLSGEMKKALDSIKRVDEKGILYEMNCSGYYDSKVMMFLLNKLGFYKTGCSAFIAKNKEGHILTGRNYDFPHPDKDGNMSALNVIVRCNPQNGYKSVGISDSMWIGTIAGSFGPGCLDDGLTDASLMALLPYICMDGINEKGVTVSILLLDLKAGETPVKQEEAGKESMMHTILMRRILDKCATVDEAIEMAKSVNMLNVRGMDFHIFVTDEKGNSCVLEWRKNQLIVNRQDAVTNFYVSADDGQDFYRDGKLADVYEKADVKKEYHWGYGHGYGRFNTIVKTLEEHETEDIALMEKEECMDLLKAVSQPHTLHSAVYDNTDRSVSMCMLMEYGNEYKFKV